MEKDLVEEEENVISLVPETTTTEETTTTTEEQTTPIALVVTEESASKRLDTLRPDLEKLGDDEEGAINVTQPTDTMFMTVS